MVVSCGPVGGCRRHGGGKGVAGVVVTVLLEDIVADLDEVLPPALEDSHCGIFSL